jgi:hypothetical protein
MNPIEVVIEADGKQGEWIALPGRYQPFHAGHEDIGRILLNAGHKVCYLVRDMEINEQNPLRAETVLMSIKGVFEKEWNKTVTACIIPDIGGIAVGRRPGFSILQLHGNKEEISASAIRAEKNEV